MTIKKQTKWHGNCIYKVREVLSPHGKEFRGYRFIVAVPNMNGHKAFSNEPAASFARSYLLFQSSDLMMKDLEAKVQGFIQSLLNRGFEKVEPADVYEERILTEMRKSKGTQHINLEEESINA